MEIGLYMLSSYSSELKAALAKGLPGYFGSNATWKFTYKQPSMAWRDTVDSNNQGKLEVEKVNDKSARLKVSTKDKKGQATSTIIGTLASTENN